MKKGLFSLVSLVIVAVVALHIMPTMVLSQTLTPISTYSYEVTSQTGPTNTGAEIADYLGFNPIGGALTGITVSGTNTLAAATSASMLNIAWYKVWDYASTQTGTDTWYWAAIYQLNGNPGWTANISLDYTYNNSRTNLALDGRTESQSSASFYADIVPASMTGNYSQNAENALKNFQHWHVAPTNPPFADYSKLGAVSYDADYHFAAISTVDDTSSGSFPVGSMGIGDQLYLVGAFTAESQAQAYAMGVEIATMVSTLDISLVLNEDPPSAVPLPPTVLLLGSGLVGLCGARRFKKQIR